MINIGITGSNGFIGKHLSNTLKLFNEEFNVIPFDRYFFDDKHLLNGFVSSCDVIVHLAALNRHEDENIIYNTNINLAKRLILSLEEMNSKAHVLISSSTQENRENLYGQSKKDARLLFSSWAKRSGSRFSGLIVPNVFGPFGLPFYNSVIATFCHQLTSDEEPQILKDGELSLIYVGELVNLIVSLIKNRDNSHERIVESNYKAKVSEILSLLIDFKELYLREGTIPVLKTDFEKHLFNTFRSYINIVKYYPKKYRSATDNRGAFVEIIRNGIAGQTSFSTTFPGITRGNHFHTRKIERFAVIQGRALIQIRKIGDEQIHNLYLSGDEPAYVDMPIWCTHNIKNVGSDLLYTVFWINEPYNENDPDTYFEKV